MRWTLLRRACVSRGRPHVGNFGRFAACSIIAPGRTPRPRLESEPTAPFSLVGKQHEARGRTRGMTARLTIPPGREAEALISTR